MHLNRRKIERMKEWDNAIKKARSNTLDWLASIDLILNAIISEYFIEDGRKKEFFETEILTRDFFTTFQKIRILSDMETSGGTPLKKRYRRLMRQLFDLNSYRNVLVHGIPLSLDKPQVWIHRGRLKPIVINRKLMHKMEATCERSFDTLSNIFNALLGRKSRQIQRLG